MRNQVRLWGVAPLSLALAALAFVFSFTGCDSDVDQPTDDGNDTIFMELAACESELECETLDYEALGIDHLESCLECTCAPSPDNAEVNTLQLHFLAVCISDLECVTTLDCAPLEDACNTATCVATECIVAPIEDPTPEGANECEERMCDPVDGWENSPLEDGTECSGIDACFTRAYCDGNGACVDDPETGICCMSYMDCTGCDEGQLNACREPTDEEVVLTEDYGRCMCVGEDEEPPYTEGSCCVAHGDPGCASPSEGDPNGDAVCVIDPWCCTEWDVICVGLYNSANPEVCEPPEEEEMPSIELVSPYNFEGCVGVPPMGSPYPSCVWDDDAGDTMTWDPEAGEVLFFTVSDGTEWPLSVDNCATGAYSFSVSPSLIFADPANLDDYNCIGTCRSGGEQILCTGPSED